MADPDRHPGDTGLVAVAHRFLADPGRAAILLDFDGTLAPIVDDAASARPIAGALPVLHRLVERYRLVAVVSGRPAPFLAEHLPVDGLVRIGSYGLERVGAAGPEVAPDAAPWKPAIAGVVARARAQAPAGVAIEDKQVTVTLHFRTAPECEPWAEDFAAREAAATGLVVHRARRSVELRPPLPVDKGSAVLVLLEGAGPFDAACFVGDDIGDLSAFAAIGAVPHPLRVAVVSDETPPELLHGADVELDGPPAVCDLLRVLAGG